MIQNIKRGSLYLVCAFSALFFCGSIIGMLFFSENPSEKQLLENGYQNIVKNYSAQLLHTYFDEDMEYLQSMGDIYANAGFEFSIVRNKTKEELEQVLYTNAKADTNFTFCNEFYTKYPDFNLRNFLISARDYGDAEGGYRKTVKVDGYVFDANKGIFYAQTADGYFEVKMIYVSYNNLVYDYLLQKKNGEYCYYNNYYDIMLDMSTISDWEWVRKDSENYLWNYAIITDSAEIEAELYDGIFYDWGGKISYYYADTTYTVYSSLGENESVWPNKLVEWKKFVNGLYSMEGKLQGIFIGSFLFFVVTFFALIFTTKATRETLTWMQKIPIGTYLFGIVCVECLLFVCLSESINRGGNLFYNYLYGIVLLGLVIAILVIGLCSIMNVTARMKAKSFWRYSELYYCVIPLSWGKKKCRVVWKRIQENSTLMGKAIVTIVILFAIEFCILLGIDFCRNVIPFFCFYKLIEIPLTILLLLQMNELQKGAKRVASGNLSEPIDTKNMFWEFKKHGEYINQSGKGISYAVEERIKSERLKTELITNVSHDIKTPLTSIINYVDLIKKENITDETILEYIDVLDRQSARLKKLIEDLMEASKASTGNLTCHMEPCNLDVFLGQIMGEFEEKLNQAGLEVVVKKPEEACSILADGRHLWRIMDNLMNNICKYSLPCSRVYINIEREETFIRMIFKNISRLQLNISSDELMERFVRGDSSRNTEGNGLGLSIAQSLAELIGASMKLDIDGDLFKVTLEFAAMENSEPVDKPVFGSTPKTAEKTEWKDDAQKTEQRDGEKEKDIAIDAEVKEL